MRPKATLAEPSLGELEPSQPCSLAIPEDPRGPGSPGRGSLTGCAGLLCEPLSCPNCQVSGWVKWPLPCLGTGGLGSTCHMGGVALPPSPGGPGPLQLTVEVGPPGHPFLEPGACHGEGWLCWSSGPVSGVSALDALGVLRPSGCERERPESWSQKQGETGRGEGWRKPPTERGTDTKGKRLVRRRD